MLEQVASLLILSATLKTFDTISSRVSTLKGPLSSYVCTTLSSIIGTHSKDRPEIKSVVNDPRLTPPFLSVVVEEVGYVGFRSHLGKRSIEGCPFFWFVFDADGNVSK